MNFSGGGGGFTNGQSRGGGGGRGRGRGGGRGRGRGRGRGGGIKFANNIAQFDVSVDAHMSQDRRGIQALCGWPENNTLFTGGLDGTVKMFNLDDASSTTQNEGREVSTLCIHEKWLFVGYIDQPVPGQDIGFVKAYNFAASPPEQFNFAIDQNFPAAHKARVSSICVGGSMVFTGSEDGAVRAWKMDGKVWKLIGVLGGGETTHNCQVRKVMCAGNNVFTGAFNGEVKVWDMQGQQVSQFQAHSDMVTDMCTWTGDGSKPVLFTCSTDRSIKVWDLAQGVPQPNSQPIFTFPSNNAPKSKPVTCMVTHKLQNGTDILVCGFADGSIQAFTLPAFVDLGFFSGHDRNAAITGLEVVKVKNLLFAGSMTGKLSCFKFVS